MIESELDVWLDALDKANARNAELENELERERMRLAACGVVAMANTPATAAKARQMHPDYWSASCGDVARAVDEEMKLRKSERLLRAALTGILESTCGNQSGQTGPCLSTEAWTKAEDALRGIE